MHPTKKHIEGTSTFKPIQYHDIPTQRKGDHLVRLQKADPYHTRITLGVDRIHYPGDCGTKTGSLETVKLLLNAFSPRLPHGLHRLISPTFTVTPRWTDKNTRIKLTDIPEEFIQEYHLQAFAYNGYIYFEVTKGIYGLKQARKLANDLLIQHLETHRYYQCTATPSLWRHTWRPVIFVLIVDDFGIQYTERRHAEHLLHTLQEH
eukprot:CCRYP_000899-RA/>CCRYP_000899-RA protein AED:0.44 eAED:0.44 QI:0/-1/0/1/-1/0/1/0/204